MLHNTLHIQSNNYNASTNTPALATATGYNDNIFQVTTQGIQTINGVSSFCGVGDQIIVSNAVSQFYVVLPVQYNAATGAVGALAVTITQLQQVGRIITISVAGTQTINGVSVAMVVGQAWEYNGSSWLNITNPFATQAQVNAGVVNNLPLAPSTFAASSQLAALAPLASPAFTGIPTAPTAALGTNTTQVASTAFVLANANTSDSYATQAQVNAGVVSNLAIAPSTFAASSQLAALAPLASPAFTGIPTAPTAALGTNTTQVASTAFVLANANTSDSYATQAEVNAGIVTNKAVAPSTFAASTQLAAKGGLALNNTWTGINNFTGQVQVQNGASVSTYGGGGFYVNSGAGASVTAVLVGSTLVFANGTNYSATGATINGQCYLSYGNGSPSGITVFSNPGSLGSTCYIGSNNAGAGGYNGIVFGANQSRPWLNNLGTTNNNGTAIATLADVIGVGQTWQNVTGSRATGVTYTNTTGRAIFVCIWVISFSASTPIYFSVNGTGVYLAGFAPPTSSIIPIAAIVPSDSTYKMSFGNVGSSVASWAELR